MANIFCDDFGDAYLADFGFVRTYSEDPMTRLGTLHYIAPEILNEEISTNYRNRAQYDNRVDVWAIGVLAHKLLTAKYPFNGKEQDII